MADVFDQLEADYQSSASLPSAQSSDPFASLEADYQSSIPRSDSAAIRNAGVRGLGAPLSILDELLPGFSPKADNALKIVPPHLFGLFGTERPAASFAGDLDTQARKYGILDDTQASSELGKLGADVVENATAATAFGPLAMALSGAFGGVGSYGGEKAGEVVGYPGAGKIVGSMLGGITPGAIGKLGIVKEIGEQLGPIASQIPGLNRIVGKGAIESAVGRGISKQATNLPAVESELAKINSFIGPLSKNQALKTVDELTGDIGLARATDATDNLLGNAGFKQIGEARTAANEATLLNGYDPKLTGYDVSKKVEQALINSDETLRGVERATWSQLPKSALVDTKLNALDDSLAASLKEITVDGALPIDGEGAALLSRFKKAQEATDEGIVNLDVIQKLRERALKLGRDTAPRLNAADRATNDVASAVEAHLRNIVDVNADAGKLAPDVADIWKGARTLTKDRIQTFAAPKSGSANAGTKALENLAINKLEPVDQVLLKEGLNSPDKLAAHIKAASKGGQDIKPFYRQALQSELDGAPQSQWASIIDRKREQWNLTHSADEMAKIDRSLDDVAQQLKNNANRVSTGSQTNPRGNIQKQIQSEKGLANVGSTATSVATLGAAGVGANEGWKRGDSYPGKVFNALVGGLVGAAAGKTFKGAATRASEAFDNLLVTALKDPREAARLIKAAKPSKFAENLKRAGISAAQVVGARAGNEVLKHVLDSAIKQNPITQQKQEQQMLNGALNRGESKLKESEKTPAIKKVEARIDADPFMSTLYEIESGRDPEAKNPESSAAGAFQLIKATQRKLGVTDPYDIEQNYTAAKQLTDENRARFGDDPAVLYAAHYLGATVLNKVLKGDGLTAKESAQVAYLKSKVLPKFEKVYKSKVTSV